MIDKEGWGWRVSGWRFPQELLSSCHRRQLANESSFILRTQVEQKLQLSYCILGFLLLMMKMTNQGERVTAEGKGRYTFLDP